MYLILSEGSSPMEETNIQLRPSTPKGSGNRDRTLEYPQVIHKTNALPSPTQRIESSPFSIIVCPSSEVLNIFQGYSWTRG